MAMEYKESVGGRYDRNNPRNLTQRDYINAEVFMTRN